MKIVSVEEFDRLRGMAKTDIRLDLESIEEDLVKLKKHLSQTEQHKLCEAKLNLFSILDNWDRTTVKVKLDYFRSLQEA